MLYFLILVIGGIAQFFGPWWIMPIVCFVLCFWKSDKPLSAYGMAFAAIATLWLGFALYQNYITQGVITNKIAELFLIPNAALLFTAVTLVGGIVAGFAGLAGYYTRKALA